MSKKLTKTKVPYPIEVLDEEDDDGTMPANVETLADAVVGHKIVFADQDGLEFVITLDNGTKVKVRDDGDCCAYTELKSFLLNVDNIDHIITGVGTTNGYTTWHIYADLGDVLEMQVGWSCGNPFYYGYGFQISVESK